MSTAIDLALIIVSIALLWKGSDILVEAASKIAASLGISDLVIGLTVVAIGTSAPEFAVTINAVLGGKSDISVSNVVGSNIFNLGFILGGTAWMGAIPTNPKLVYRDGLFLIGVTLLLSYFLFNASTPGQLSLDRWEGFILLGLLVSYLTFLFVKKEPLEEDAISHEKVRLLDIGLLLLGVGAVVGGGDLLVDHASNMARSFGVSDWVIGVTIVAAGTSAPELATSITAALKNKHAMAVGNLIGSDLFNLLGVLGLAGVLKKSLIVSPSAESSMIMLVIMVIVVVGFMRTGWRVSRAEGAFLVIVNLIRWVFDFMSKS